VTIVTSRITSATPRFVLRLWIVGFIAVSFIFRVSISRAELNR